MQAPKLHAGEIDISTGLAARLIAEQFPHWAGLPVSPVSVKAALARRPILKVSHPVDP
jgi:hypothetical protein